MTGWLKGIIYSYLKEAVKEYGKFTVVQMRPDCQYLLVVQDDETARQVVDAMQDTFDVDQMPRLAVISSPQVKLIEIARSDINHS